MVRTMRQLQLAKQRPDTAADIRHRRAANEAARLVADEVAEKFTPLGADNIHEALAFQTRRMAEVTAALMANAVEASVPRATLSRRGR